MEVHMTWVSHTVFVEADFYRKLRGMIIKGTSSILSLAKSTRGNYGVGLFSLFAREK